MTRRKSAVTTVLATAAIGMGLVAAPASAEPSPSACHGQTVKSFVQQFGSGRAAAEAFFGDQPHAVQEGQRAIRDDLCAAA